jgi:hypothetical protein
LRLRERVLDEQDERRAAEAQRRSEKVAAQQRLIDSGLRQQMATKRLNDDFLDRQIDRQQQKESREIEELTARRVKLAEERRRDFLESGPATAVRRTMKQDRQMSAHAFPWHGEDEAIRQAEERRAAAQKATRDCRDFQLRQAREKKQTEAAEKERSRLEFRQQVAEDEAFMRRAQDYAASMLAKAHQDDNDFAYYD